MEKQDKVQPEKQAEKRAEKVGKNSNIIKVVCPSGRMVNLLTNQEIVGETEVELDGFIQSQLDSGILVKV